MHVIKEEGQQRGRSDHERRGATHEIPQVPQRSEHGREDDACAGSVWPRALRGAEAKSAGLPGPPADKDGVEDDEEGVTPGGHCSKAHPRNICGARRMSSMS